MKKEGPGALAGAAEAYLEFPRFRSEEYRRRAVAARALCDAIAECHCDDAKKIMEGVLEKMRAGPPTPPLLSLMAEARDWADLASPSERKAYALASAEHLSPADRAGLINHLQGGRA